MNYDTTPTINAIVEAVHTTGTRAFDVLEMRLPADEWRVLECEMEQAEMLSRRITKPKPPGPACIEVHTAFGLVRLSEEKP